MRLKTKYRFCQKVALIMAWVMLLQVAFPATTFALTSGPTQPEVQTFEPVGTTQMVDLFSGDFNYNIPLLEVPGANGGYPINLFYNSVTSMEEEASMVGLGWNVGIGALTNNVRGVPDALNGEMIRHKKDMKTNWTIGAGFSAATKEDLEIFGGDLQKFDLFSGTQVIGQGQSGNTSYLELTLGFKLMYNSYKGFGYSFDPGISATMGNRDVSKSGTSLTSSFGFSLNSLEGVTSNAGVSLSKTERGLWGKMEGKTSGGLGMSISGRQGLKSLTGNYLIAKKKKGELKTTGGSQTYSFANPTYMPGIDIPYGGWNAAFSAKFGADLFGVFGTVTLSGFYSQQKLKQKNKWVSAPAYGYMHQQNANRDNAIMDFNREKDGQIYHNQTNLAIPVATPDILSVAGHGVGGSYRAYRSDWGGVFLDQAIRSSSGGGSLGIEFGAGGAGHFGIDGAVNWSNNESKRPNISVGNFDFHSDVLGSDFEPYYYKAMGDVSAEIDPASIVNEMGGDEPIQLNRDGLDFGNSYTTKSGANLAGTVGKRQDENRKSRSNNIQSITNKELLKVSGGAVEEMIPEYKINYFNGANQTAITDYNTLTYEPLTREQTQEDNIAGYTVLNDGGVKWNYALPVINHKQYEASFSVDSPSECKTTVSIAKQGGNAIDNINHDVNNTEEYLDVIETPAYAHAHLLTSVLGTDYLDYDDVPGPSDGDKGYWMRVDYVKTANNYIWKTPFGGASFIEGYNSKDTDDKATFISGKRDQYYPGKVTTNTHVAEFIYSKRKDSRAAGTYTHNSASQLGAYSYKLEAIKLYSKAALQEDPEAKPIKTVHFEYSYELCKGVLNNLKTAEGDTSPDKYYSRGELTFPNEGGKLTLKKVWFTYENSTRGALSPYTFEYNGSNQNYSSYAFDRWGAFKSEPGTCGNVYNPYVKQFSSLPNGPVDNGSTLNAHIKAWHLSDIYLPSGSHIELTVERDQYAYVQDRVATQMFKIKRVGPNPNDNMLNNSKDPNADELKIYFDLEEAIPVGNGTYNDPQVLAALSRYTDDLHESSRGKQIFYKVNADLTNHQTAELNEDVGGYADIEKIGVDYTCNTNNNGYTEAFIQLKPFPLEVRNKSYHPILMGNWQFLKVNLPDKMFGYNLGSKADTDADIVNKVGQLGGMLKELIATFRKYYHFCRDNDYGRRIDLDKSFVRLNTPDLKKYGDGLRVKKVTMEDTYWGDIEKTPVYGVVYDYDVVEKVYDPEKEDFIETGRMISSGVATNEPSVGREECALRYSKSFKEEVKFRSDNQFFFEYPVNESYYPGPSVGYSNVTVKSLASEYAYNQANNEPTPPELPNDLPDGFATTGVTVNEFYTAKDFPIVTEETTIDSDRNPIRWIPIPLIGQIRIDKFTATQGYMIELNDMHGKAKKTTSFAQDNQGNIIKDPVSSVEYIYQEEPLEVYTQGKKNRLRHRLNNEVTVLLSEKVISNGAGNETERATNAEMGVERELFVDARETRSVSNSGGLNFNTEVLPIIIPIPVPVPWPSVASNTTKVKTSVTNKVIRRTGILSKVIAYDGQSMAVTENIAFDQYTGSPILSTINNEYDDKIYNYNVPAHFAYEKMGPAYENSGFKFKGGIGSFDNNLGYYVMEIVPGSGQTVGGISAKLKEGDEFIMSQIESNDYAVPGFPANNVITVEDVKPFNRATLIKKELDGDILLSIENSLNPGEFIFHLVRSGNRNHLAAAVGSIASLENDPTIDRGISSCRLSFDTPSKGGTVGSKDLAPTIYTEDNVINASAMTYDQGWIVGQLPFCIEDDGPCPDADGDGTCDDEDLCEGPEPGSPCADGSGVVDENCDCIASLVGQSIVVTTPKPNPYKTGELGIWRAHRTYTFVTDREQSTPVVDLDVDGTYVLDIFDWKNPLTLECSDRWRMVEEITKYGPNSQVLETRNILDIYNTSLYGYGDYLPTAVASNAEYFELGFESFEEYDLPLATVSLSDYEGIRETGHINFLNTCTEYGSELLTWGEKYAIHGLISNLAINNIFISKETSPDDPIPTRAILSLIDPITGERCSIPVDVLDLVQSPGNPFSVLTIQPNFLQNYLPPNTCFTGDVALEYEKVVSTNQDYYDVYMVKIGHTGNQCLMVAESVASFEQKTLKLEAGKDYVFSAWMNVQTPGPVPTYDDGYNKIVFDGETFKPSGTIVEGWQRVEGTFTHSGQDFSMDIHTSGYPMHLDDFRVFPADGNMQSYVYDKTNYRVTEILDDNNYFTRYKYDSEGGLISVQKETTEGLKSLQESRSYVKSDN